MRVPGKGKSRRRRAQQTRTFATTIAQLEQLADWLDGFGVTLVGMEATGVYWKPVFYVLERRFECWLITAMNLFAFVARRVRGQLSGSDGTRTRALPPRFGCDCGAASSRRRG